jgi:hypothetical protein
MQRHVAREYYHIQVSFYKIRMHLSFPGVCLISRNEQLERDQCYQRRLLAILWLILL